MANDLMVAGCLTKPISASQLLEEIERLENVQDILIIDDDRGFCQLVERILAKSGQPFAIYRAYDGLEGMSAMLAQPPDLVLLDLIMPKMDGFQVLEEMQINPELADIPVVLLTASSYVEDALAQNSSQIVVKRWGGLPPGEVLGCLRALIDVLKPSYDKWSAAGEVLYAGN
jgi:CheY-like chemotaxis protein